MEYITTAIVYPNSRIHVGWAWECLGSDWLVRALKLQGKDTYFATGMDEHSINVQRKAESEGLSPKAYCDKMATDIEKVLRQMGMGYDRFIRTSDPDHEWVVQQLVKKAYDSGDIYKAKYEGHYCEGCEAFYTEKDLIEGGLCPAHKTKPKWISEENYFFKLSKYQDKLLQLFKDQPQFLQPEYRRAEVVNFIQAGLKDFSISRSTFTWGVSLPWDPSHVVYVWFDALINYLTAAGLEFKLRKDLEGKGQGAGPAIGPAQDSTGVAPASPSFEAVWPARVHIIGKDISRFHCVYWPAMLMALDIPLPKSVFAHGYITIRGDRMSKSSGNVVTPDEVMAWSGPDPFRYYLLAENQFAQDGNFAPELLILKNNADLSNDWGNLVNRSISMTRKYFPDSTLSRPAAETHSREVRESFERLPGELDAAIRAIDPSAYAKACTDRSRVLNLYIDKTKPWSLSKLVVASQAPGATVDAVAAGRDAEMQLREVLYTLLEGIRWVATCLMPVLPFGMPRVFDQLAIPRTEEKGALARLKWGELTYKPGEPSPLYPRLELPGVEGEAGTAAPGAAVAGGGKAGSGGGGGKPGSGGGAGGGAKSERPQKQSKSEPKST